MKTESRSLLLKDSENKENYPRKLKSNKRRIEMQVFRTHNEEAFF